MAGIKTEDAVARPLLDRFCEIAARPEQGLIGLSNDVNEQRARSGTAFPRQGRSR
jgi:hypothetical protein